MVEGWGGMNALISRLVVLSRWVMVPLLLGLILALVLLVGAFFITLWKFGQALPTATEPEVMMALLTLIDFTLIGGLIVIVISSGYESFVAKIPDKDRETWPTWMTRVSFSGLKQKLFVSMMAISGITLLKGLMRLEVSVSEAQVRWLAVANVIFIVAYAVLTLTDYVVHRDNGHNGNGHNGNDTH